MTSQLNVDTIVDKAGSGGTNVKIGNTSTYVSDGGGVTQDTVDSLVKARFRASDAAVLTGSFNFSSGTDNGTGDYTYSFTSSMSNTNYAICATAANTSAGQPVVSACPANDEQTTSQFNVEQGYTTNTSAYSNFDSEDYVSIFGDLA